jgi:hypothetical protein
MPASLSHRKRMLAHLEQQAEATSRLLLQPVSVALESAPMSIPFTMSPEDQARHEIEWAARLAKFAPLLDLTPGQQFALFMLASRQSQLAADIVEQLRKSTVRAGAQEYAELLRRGYAMRDRATVYHVITPAGRFQADRLAKIAAKELGIHSFVTRADRLWNHISCMGCGWSHRFTADVHHVQSINAKWMSRHLREVGEQRATIIAGSAPADSTRQAQEVGK